METMNEYVGVIHTHTVYSDGSGTVQDLADAARKSGLDYLVVTDHNACHPEEAGWRDGVLVLMGEEVDHDVDGRSDGHLLAVGIQRDVSGLKDDFQRVVDEIVRQGGVAFAAHPYERGSWFMPRTYFWKDWSIDGLTGIELWNFLSEFRGYTKNVPLVLAVAYFPRFFTTGPWPETLQLWDRLISQWKRPVVAIGGVDAHAAVYSLGPISKRFMPYEHCFRSVTTHILTEERFTGTDFRRDEKILVDALRRGHAWIGYEWLGSTAGFRFWAKSGGRDYVMGDVVSGPSARLYIRLPGAGEIRLLRDGAVVASTVGDALEFRADAPGAYRVEVWRKKLFKKRGWIFSNPVYLGFGDENS